MPDVDALLDHPARYFYDEATPEEKRLLDELILSIREDPEVDGLTKTAFPVAAGMLTLYADERFWALYFPLNDWTIFILNIGRVGRGSPT